MKLLIFYLLYNLLKFKLSTIEINQYDSIEDIINKIHTNDNCVILSNGINTYLNHLKKYRLNSYNKISKYLENKANYSYLFSDEYAYKMSLISFTCGIDIDSLAIYNLMTEIEVGACTSIIFKEYNTNIVYLFSNLDWLNNDILITTKYRLIYKNIYGEVIFEALGFIGMLGVTRVQTKNWAMTFNVMYKNVNLYLQEKRYTVLEMIYNLAIDNYNYEYTKNNLIEYLNFTGGFYMIISKTEGCLITKYYNNKEKIYCINDKTPFIIQTNKDRSEENKKDVKRETIEKYLTNNYENLDKEKIEKYLSKPPAYVPNSTFFTTTSVVGKNFDIICYDKPHN